LATCIGEDTHLKADLDSDLARFKGSPVHPSKLNYCSVHSDF
jgi:hypothetical protein